MWPKWLPSVTITSDLTECAKRLQLGWLMLSMVISRLERSTGRLTSDNCCTTSTCSELSGSLHLQYVSPCTGYQYTGTSSLNCLVMHCVPCATCPAYLMNIVEPIGASWMCSSLRLTLSMDFTLPFYCGCAQSLVNVCSHTLVPAWNALPEDLCTIADPAEFRKQLKTLFSWAFNVISFHRLLEYKQVVKEFWWMAHHGGGQIFLTVTDWWIEMLLDILLLNPDISSFCEHCSTAYRKIPTSSMKNAPSHKIWALCDTWFLEPDGINTSNSISISSAVFMGLASVSSTHTDRMTMLHP